ncbi:MAG: glycosyltransferase [Bacteroidota bacterium]
MAAHPSDTAALRPVVHVTTVHPLRDPRIAAKAVPSLRAAGYDARLIARHTRSETIPVSVGGGIAEVPVEALPVSRSAGGRPTAKERLVLQGAVWDHLVRLRPALVHLHDPELLPLGWRAQRRLGARVVYDRHEAYDRRPGAAGRALARLERWAFGWLDHTVLAEASYAAALPLGAPHTLVRNHALPPATLPLPKSPPSVDTPLRLVYAGTVSEARGLTTMLTALRLARDAGHDWHLTLVGRAPRATERARAEAFLHAQTLHDHVTLDGWTDFVPPESMAPYLAAAHVGLCMLAPHPNYVGSMPTKLYDYLQHALPFVCSDVPLWDAFATVTGSGVTSPPDDPVALVAAILRLTSTAYAVHTTAASEAAPHYRWDTEATKLVALYAALLGEKSAEEQENSA